MKIGILLNWILLAMVVVSSDTMDRIAPAGNITSVAHSVVSFDEIVASDAFQVSVDLVDTEPGVSIEANENLHAYIQVYSVGNSLILKLKDHTRIKGNAVLTAHESTRQINAFAGSGASIFYLKDTLRMVQVDVDLSGASRFAGSILAADLNVVLSGASSVFLEGNCTTLRVASSGASVVRNFDFTTENVELNMTGASSTWLTLTDKINVAASGASSLFL